MQIDPNSIQWDDAPVQQGGPVYGPPPKPPSASEQQRVDIARQNLALQQDKFDYQREKDGSTAGDLEAKNEAAKTNLMRVIGYMNRVALDADDNDGLMETGTSGNIGRSIPIFQTAGKDLAANIQTLRANYAFDALNAMREASKTGGALGNVTEMELKLLESAVANIDPSQSHPQFLENIQGARQAYLAKLAMIDPQLATRMGYDADKAEAALLALNDAYNKEFGLDGAVEIDRSPNPQTSNPADIDAIMAKYGAQ